MSRPGEVTWGTDDHQVVNTTEELDALLDRIGDEARRRGRPRNVELVAGRRSGTLSVVVGHHRSVLSHIPEDGNPPYMSSRGTQDEDRPFTFYVAGEHHSETHWRHTVPAETAREATRMFLLTGRLDDRMRWDEV